jgi:outer membrane protein
MVNRGSGIMRREFYIFMLAVIISLQPLSAEETLTLRQSINVSLQNNNSYKIAIEKVKENRYRVRETWGALWPELSTDVAYTRQDAEAGLSSRVAGQYDIQYVNGKIAVNAGVFYHSLKASRKAYIVAENEVRKIKADTIINTIKLYYGLILTREMIKLRSDSLKALEENLKVITMGYRKGTFSKLDYLRAQVAFSNEKTKLINTENDFYTARAAFNIHMGRDINASINIDERAIRIYNKELSDIPFKQEKGNEFVKKMIREALKNRPEVIQIKLKREIEAHTAGAAESIYLWPTIFVTGNYGTSKLIPRDGDTGTITIGDPTVDPILQALNEGMQQSYTPSGWNRAWSITFGATYRWGSLFPLEPSHAKGQQYRSRAKQTDLQMEDFIRGVRLEVQQGYLKLKSATNSIRSQRGNIETAEESLRVSIIQFRNGIIDNTKLLEANVELATAKTLYIQALHDYQLAKAELNRAIGEDYFTFR